MKTKKTLIIALRLLIVSLGLMLHSNCVAQKGVAPIQNNAKASKALVIDLIEAYMELPSTPPGMSVAIGVNDSIAFAEGFGFSNVENKEKVTIKTQFRAASVSKIITATVLAKLIEAKQLSLNDHVHKYIPAYAQKADPVTIKQLSGHVSGVPHYSYQDKREKRYYGSVEDAMHVFSHIPLLHEPGTQYKYSTHGYTLLSRVLEKASNKNFLELLNETICIPLAMNGTGPHMISSPSTDMTQLYGFQKNIGYVKITSPEDPSYKWAGGGLMSTPSDLVTMANGYINGFIKKDIVDTMFSTQTLNSGKATGVGVGWRQNWDIDNREVYEHAGSMEGTRTVISLFPKDKLSIAIMFNAYGVWRIEETAHMLAFPFLTQSSPKPQPKGGVKLDVTVHRDGTSVLKKGELILDGDNNRLVLDTGTEEEVSYQLKYMQRDNIYALLHPHGILYTELSFNNDTVTGKTMYYGSPNISKPSEKQPLFVFKGHLKQ
ncbi:serine hydrolase domain-containing protein [Flavivirga algicola]|uniref:Beta-lactamase family protein n=1 Tax=Flavivirga algicola TaxID=2729136 RepID=A0ABX1S0U8_9FLAO|nr:serine hydrolase domain-containing protein [Flavivirga algicola]NMH88252.1 beta-lactamase family protein [Flavivirga algicola]